jgi:peptidoglycan LD-endopeptidase CwlK
MFVSVISCLCATIFALGWVGWRYFLAPLPVAGSRRPVVVQQVPSVVEDSESGEVRAIRFPFARRISLRAHGALLLALLFAGVTAAGVLALSGRISLDPLSAPDLERQEHIQATLNPEALVPPPPLPPSIFVGTERPGLETANRDWSRLDPDFMTRALIVFARMEARGYPLALLEGYRSPDRQDVLAASHIHVTNAKAFQSKHQYGLALDAAPIRNGRLVISERDPWAMEAYQAFGEEAEKAGLTWGGRWKLKDYGHIEASGTISEHLQGK